MIEGAAFNSFHITFNGNKSTHTPAMQQEQQQQKRSTQQEQTMAGHTVDNQVTETIQQQ